MTNAEIDEAVAKRLGWTDLHMNDMNGQLFEPRLFGMRKDDRWDMAVPNYSTDIKAAWEIVEHVKEKYAFDMATVVAGWWVAFSDAQRDSLVEEEAETAPLAICKAFLAMDGAPLPADVEVKEGAD